MHRVIIKPAYPSEPNERVKLNVVVDEKTMKKILEVLANGANQ